MIVPEPILTGVSILTIALLIRSNTWLMLGVEVGTCVGVGVKVGNVVDVGGVVVGVGVGTGV